MPWTRARNSSRRGRAPRAPGHVGGHRSLVEWAEATFDPLPFDLDAARAFGLVFSATQKAGRKGRRRVVNLMIASVATAHGLPLYTRNAGDFRGLSRLVEIVAC